MARFPIEIRGFDQTSPSGGGSTPIGTITAIGQAANKVPVTDGADGVNWDVLANIASGTPTPDTVDGDPGATGTVADGGHTHPASDLYDLKGLDSVNTVPASGSAVTLPDPSSEQTSLVTLTASTVNLTFPAAALGSRFTLFMQQDSTGSRAPLFPANVGWLSSGQPTWSSTAGAIDVVNFYCPDGQNWYPTWAPLIGLASPAVPLNLVQSLLARGSGFSAPTSLTFPGNVTPGSALIAFFEPLLPGSVALSGGGVTWTQIESGWTDGSSTAVNMQAWLGLDSTGGGGTATISFGTNVLCGVVVELAGVVPASALDGSPVVSNYSSFPATTSPVTPTLNGDGVVLCIYGNNGTPEHIDGTQVWDGVMGTHVGTYTTASGWTLLVPNGSADDFPFLALKLNSTAGQPYDITINDVAGGTTHQSTLGFLLKNQS